MKETPMCECWECLIWSSVKRGLVGLVVAGLLTLAGGAEASQAGRDAAAADMLGLSSPVKGAWFVRLVQPLYLPPQFVYTHQMLCTSVDIFYYQYVPFLKCTWAGGQITVYWSQVLFRVRVESPVVQPGGAVFEGDWAPGEEGPDTNGD